MWCSIKQTLEPNAIKKMDLCAERCGNIEYTEEMEFQKHISKMGQLSRVSVGGKPGYIVKHMRLGRYNMQIQDETIIKEDDFHKEVKLLKKVSNLKILTPVMLNSWTCTDKADNAKYGFILMRDWCYKKEECGNLESQIDNNLEYKNQNELFKILERYLQAYYILHLNDIVHYDVRRPNVLYHENPNLRDGFEVGIIDFGLSDDVKNWPPIIQLKFFILDILGVVQFFTEKINMEGLTMSQPLNATFQVLEKIDNPRVMNILISYVISLLEEKYKLKVRTEEQKNLIEKLINQLVQERWNAGMWVKASDIPENIW